MTLLKSLRNKLRKNRLSFIVLFLNFTPFLSFSKSEITVQWGQPEVVKFRKKFTPAPIILGEQFGKLFVSTTLKGKVTLHEYNLSTLNKVKSKLLPLMGNYSKNTVESIEFFNSTIRYCKLKAWYDAVLNIYDYNVNDFSLKEEKQLLSREIVLTNANPNLSNYYLPVYYQSEDLIFVMDRIIKLKNYTEDVAKFNGYLYAKSGELLFHKKISLPTEKFVIDNVKISSDSVVYILGFSYEGKVPFKLSFESRDRYPPGDFTIARWDLRTDKMVSKIIQIEDSHVFDLDLFVNEDNIQVVGFSSSTKEGFNSVFTEKFELSNLESQFHTSVDIPKEIIYKTWKEADKTRNEKNYNSTPKKFTKPYLDSFDEIKVLFDDNGNLFITSQEALYSLASDDIGDKPNGPNYVKYGKILAMKFNQSFDLVWADMVNKNQYTMKDRGLEFSYYPFLIDDMFFLMYNNTEKYDDLLFKGFQFTKGNANLAKLKNRCYLRAYNRSGESIGKTTIQTAHDYAKILPISTYQTKNKELILISKHKNKIWFGLLPFKRVIPHFMN